jgi:hypothetical protein
LIAASSVVCILLPGTSVLVEQAGQLAALLEQPIEPLHQPPVLGIEEAAQLRLDLPRLASTWACSLA